MRGEAPGTEGGNKTRGNEHQRTGTRARVEAREKSTETEDIGDTGGKGGEKQETTETEDIGDTGDKGGEKQEPTETKGIGDTDVKCGEKQQIHRD